MEPEWFALTLLLLMLFTQMKLSRTLAQPAWRVPASSWMSCVRLRRPCDSASVLHSGLTTHAWGTTTFMLVFTPVVECKWWVGSRRRCDADALGGLHGIYHGNNGSAAYPHNLRALAQQKHLLPARRRYAAATSGQAALPARCPRGTPRQAGRRHGLRRLQGLPLSLLGAPSAPKPASEPSSPSQPRSSPSGSWQRSTSHSSNFSWSCKLSWPSQTSSQRPPAHGTSTTSLLSWP